MSKKSSIKGPRESHPSDLNPEVWGEAKDNFNPERNRRIMQEVADNNWEVRQKKKDEWMSEMEYRADAFASFVTSDTFRNNKSPWREPILKQYFGKELAKIRGQMWVDRLRSAYDPSYISTATWGEIKRKHGAINVGGSRRKNSAK